MISLYEALKIIDESVPLARTEKVPLMQSLNRVLAADIISDGYMPPFDKSAMDGFACRREDLDNGLDIIGEVPAGIEYKGIIGQNQCVRIMTGAMVPAGANYVLMKEDAEEIEPGKILSIRKKAGENICYKGEDLKPGDIVIPNGTLIQPASIAMLASVGNVYPLVYRQPSVAVVSTGSELVEPWETPSSACIRNSNAYQLLAQLQTMNINARYLGIVADNESKIEETLTGAIESFDVVIISGGVSVGDFDFVPRILSKLGVKALFHGMNVKPGKHLLFGRKGNCSVFGMPGNPVSSFVQFLLLVQPLILKLSGSTKETTVLHTTLETDYFRKKTDTMSLVPVTFSAEGKAIPLEYHGSAHIHAYIRAEGIMEIPEGISEIKKGALIRVRPL